MTRRSGLTLAAIILFMGATTPRAQDEGFTPLFNGKDLSGWVYGRRGDGTENRTGKGYQVENGVLFTTKEDGGNLFTEKQYADFVLRFDFKLTENANNGIGIRAPLVGDAAYVGMEIQVLDDSGSEYRNLRPAQYHGSIYQMFPAKRGHQKPVGEWNVEEITVQGRKIVVKLNGVTITEGNLDDVKDEALLAKHRDLSKPEGSRGIANTTGHIGLLGHGTRVEFRNIRIKGALAGSQSTDKNRSARVLDVLRVKSFTSREHASVVSQRDVKCRGESCPRPKTKFVLGPKSRISGPALRRTGRPGCGHPRAARDISLTRSSLNPP